MDGPMKDLLIEALLHEDESSSLDFKREQYRFDGASDDEKSELLKDILALSNAWRRSDAYILIGVEEVRGGRSRAIGVQRHLEDAKLQQFVNSKTQKVLRFSYQVSVVDGVEIGVISIPVQNPPFFLKKDFGRLKKHTVYTRHGSSTSTADPDEIARMVETRLDSANAIARFEDQARREWNVVERQALTSVELSFMHRVEMPVVAFMKYVEGVQIRFIPDSRFRTSEETISLCFRKVSDVADLQSAFRLVAAKANNSHVSSGRVSIWRMATNHEAAATRQTDEPETDVRAPNTQTDAKARIRRVTGMLTSITMRCDGWAYTSSTKDVWTDAATRACGLWGTVEWIGLGWESICATVQDLGRLHRLEVCLPSDFDLRPSDQFQLTWHTSGQRALRLRLENLRFAQEEWSRAWFASLTGPELYAHFAQQFVDERTRELMAVPGKDAR
jgi:hypothetical protein